MAIYDATHTVKEELEAYFIKNNLGEEGGLNKAWGKIKIGPIYLPIPNPPARKKALVFHDIHHIVTGYDVDWKGEFCISAWEVATGCGGYYVAWILDVPAIGMGLFLYPKSVFKAFIRGKRSLNLYHHTLSREEARAMRIGNLQKHLQLVPVDENKASSKEIISFLGWSVFSLLLLFVPFLLIYIIFIK